MISAENDVEVESPCLKRCIQYVVVTLSIHGCVFVVLCGNCNDITGQRIEKTSPLAPSNSLLPHLDIYQQLDRDIIWNIVTSRQHWTEIRLWPGWRCIQLQGDEWLKHLNMQIIYHPLGNNEVSMKQSVSLTRLFEYKWFTLYFGYLPFTLCSVGRETSWRGQLFDAVRAQAGDWSGADNIPRTVRHISQHCTSGLELQTKLRENFTITEKAPARVISWLKHYAKWA